MTMKNTALCEKYRPTRHFSAPYGWLNDPNGLVYCQGEWHLFYQHYPMDTVWGPMHWGHAVSNDLIHWQHAPIALQPDSLGYIFSGSAVVDKQNSSGFFEQKSDNNLIAFYTASLNLSQIKLNDIQSQCVAYSKDGGIHWQKYENNPVIKNPLLACYRDPKVFWHETSRHWIMVITHGQAIGIYRSKNLTDWHFCSEFGNSEGFHSQGPWECPDLFEVLDDNQCAKWVLIVGIGSGCPVSGSGTQYFIGGFDGQRFINDNESKMVNWLDYGRDYYATQTWSNAPDNRRVGISWLSNWQYARNTETQYFRNVMSAAKEYRLLKQENRYFLAQSFAEEMYADISWVRIDNHTSTILHQPLFLLKGKLRLEQNASASITLFDNTCSIRIARNNSLFSFEVYRGYHGTDEVMKNHFPHCYQFSETLSSTENSFELLVDHGTLEFHFSNGKVSISQLNFPEKTAGYLYLSGLGWNEVEYGEIK